MTTNTLRWIVFAMCAVGTIVLGYLMAKESGLLSSKEPGDPGTPEQLEAARAAKAKIKDDLMKQATDLGIEFNPDRVTANQLRALISEHNEQQEDPKHSDQG